MIVTKVCSQLGYSIWNISPYFNCCPFTFIEILPKYVFLLHPFIFLGDVLFIHLERGSTLGPVLGLLVTVFSKHRMKRLQISTEFGLPTFLLLVQVSS